MAQLPHAPGLYMLVSPSGGQYIGMTTRSMRRRFWRHIAAANAGETTRIAKAFRKYGKENIEAIPLIVCEDLEALRLMEEQSIRVFGTAEGRNYNIYERWNDAPDTTGYRHTVEARQRIAAAQKGRVRSVETRVRISVANLGKVLSSEHRARLALAKTGVKVSFETRAKMSTSRMKTVIVGDMIYSSHKEAAERQGVSRSCVSQRISSEKFKDWYHA